MQSPNHRDLALWPTYANASEVQEVFEIDSPKKNSLTWSVLLSYLIPAAEQGNFGRSLSLITGGADEASSIMNKKEKQFNLDETVIRNRLKNANPFKNAHTLYRDDNLIKLMQILKIRLNRFADKLKKEGRTYDDDLKLEVASRELKCHIDLFEESVNKQYYSIPHVESENSGESPRIILFRHVTSTHGVTYGFGLAKDYSGNRRRKALKHVLRLAKVKFDLIPQILELVDSKHFLIKLIQCSAKSAIPTIYQSSYILMKMKDIGLDIDPLSVDEQDGLSAFFHCFDLDDMKLFFVLYRHVINFISSEGERAKSDREVLTSLQKARISLENDFRVSRKFQNLGNRKANAIRKYEQVMRFNRYQCEIVENIIHVKDDSSTEPNAKINAMIILILTKYDNYYYFDQKNEESRISQLDDYVNYFDYHEQLDNFTYLLFFDYFLLLKTRIGKSNEQIFADAIISLFRYLISKTIFPKVEFSSNHDRNDNTESLYFIPFRYWLKIKDHLKDVLHELGHSETEAVISTTDIIIKYLKNDSLIKEEAQISRLKLYLRTGIETSFDSDPIKTGLVIERTLQVTGETLCKIEYNGEVTPLLKYCLPKGMEKEFCDIRNDILSHYHVISAQGRVTSKTESFWSEVQFELQHIFNMFDSVFILQTLRVKERMIDEFIQEASSFSGNLNFHQKMIQMKENIRLTRRNFYRSHEDKYILLACNMIHNFKENLKNGNGSQQNFFKNHFNCFEFLLNFIADYCDKYSDELIGFCRELEILITTTNDNLSQDFINRILDIFLKLEKALCSIQNISKTQSYDTSFPRLSRFYNDIKQHEIFSSEDKKSIRRGFTEYLEKPRKARLELIDNYDQIPSIQDSLKDIFVSEKIKSKIKRSKNPKEAIDLLKDISDDGERLLGTDEEFCKKFLSLLGEKKFKKIIPDLPLSMRLHEKIRDLSNQKLQFVIDRINLLKKIIIDDDKHILKLRRYGTSPKCKDHTKRLMRQQFMEDMETRAALETLLLDCLEIMKKKEEFKDLWQKTTSHFAGINLRDFLSHGCPIFETVNDLLDREDYPKEIIDTTLALINDLPALEVLVELWEKVKYSKSIDLKDFIEKDDTPDEYSSLKDKIKQCDRWKSYLLLLPLN